MCYETSARPPLPPIAGGDASDGPGGLTLTSEDGTEFSAFSARAGEPGGPGIVIMPDVRGLHAFYIDLAQRFAESGVHATVIDYFGRTAGLDPRGDDFDSMSHIRQTKPDTISLDVAATIAHLRSDAGGRASDVFTVGFCFGGRNSFNQAALGHGLAGVIGFYGVPQQRDDSDLEAPTLQAANYACPVLGLFGGADQAITSNDVDAFRKALEDAGVVNEIVVYPGAPHSFFDRSYQEHSEASADAWRRMLRFLGRTKEAGK